MTSKQSHELISPKIADVTISAAGFLIAFLIALGINFAVARRNEMGTYRSMLTAVQAEASQNLELAKNRDIPNIEMSDPVALGLASNPVFLKRSTNVELDH